MALDSKLPKWKGLGVSGHRQQRPQNLAGTQPWEGHGPCGAHSKIHVSPTGITCSQHPACSVQHCPGTPRIPGIPSPATSPKATSPSALGASVWLLPCPLGAPKSLQAVRTRVGISPPSSSSPWKTGRFEEQAGGSSPHRPTPTGWAKKAPGWEVFPSCSLRSQIPLATAQIPPAPGLAYPTAGRTRCPRRVWGSHGAVGRVCPPRSMPESLPSWHSQAQTRWQCPAGSGTQCHRGGGHRGTQRQREKVPGKARPGAGGAAGTAQPRGSCNTEKPGSACQARGSSGSLPCRLESRPGGRGARGRQENTPGSLC